MKTNVSIVLLMLISAPFVFAQINTLVLESEVPMGSFAVMTMTEKEYDFGHIEKDVPVEHEFNFLNSGDAPLIVSEVKTSCGCTATDYSKTPIGPDESGFVRAVFNASKTGPFSKTIHVRSNSGEVQLRIKGVVE